jgi:chorismate mutase
MDRLNGELVEVLQRRARLAVEIGRVKERLGMGAVDRVRESGMLKAAVDAAPEGFSREELARVLKVVFGASRRRVERERGKRR